MRITFDAAPLVSGKLTGIGRCEKEQTAALAAMFREDRCEYSFFTSGKDDRMEHMRKLAGKNIKLNPSSFSGYIYRAASAAVPVPYSYFFGRRSDITHFFNYIVPAGVYGRKVVTVHDMVCKAFPETVRTRTRLMLAAGLEKSMQRADIIVTDSEFSRREIDKYYPEYSGKVRVVYCGTDTNIFRPINSPETIGAVKQYLGISGSYFLYIGTVEPRKNLLRLVRAYRLFLENHSGDVPKLVLAGAKGWLCGDIYEEVSRPELEGKVILTGYVPDSHMPYLMNGAEAFLFPSLYEGFGLPPLEAMACGVPVLTSAEASLPEVVGDCAVICDAYSSVNIAEGMSRIYSDRELRKRLSRDGVRRAALFSWESSAEKLHRIYSELLR